MGFVVVLNKKLELKDEPNYEFSCPFCNSSYKPHSCAYGTNSEIYVNCKCVNEKCGKEFEMTIKPLVNIQYTYFP